jgi:hypothetical protein
MSNDDLEHIKKLLEIKIRTMRDYEEKIAKYRLETPTHIKLDYEDIQKEIAQLETLKEDLLSTPKKLEQSNSPIDQEQLNKQVSTNIETTVVMLDAHALMLRECVKAITEQQKMIHLLSEYIKFMDKDDRELFRAILSTIGKLVSTKDE